MHSHADYIIPPFPMAFSVERQHYNVCVALEPTRRANELYTWRESTDAHTTQWNLHGWDWLSGYNPEVIRVRNGILQPLDRVPEPDRTNRYGRLTSKLNHPPFPGD